MLTLRHNLLAFTVIAIAALAAGRTEACPAGSQFFAYGGAGGCVADGQQVMRCYNMGQRCPSGWSNEGQAEAGSWCCPPPKQTSIPQPTPAPKRKCVWRGTGPICDGECGQGEDRSGVSSKGCITGYKILCCAGGALSQ